ncbi:MAG TPA: hypothetical protein VIX89_06780 [Bryobacteraceae bacterium]
MTPRQSPRIQIDRLTLKLSGSSGYAGDRLARLVAERLAVSDVPNVRGRIGALRLKVADAGGDEAQMAGRIADGLLEMLKRSV